MVSEPTSIDIRRKTHDAVESMIGREILRRRDAINGADVTMVRFSVRIDRRTGRPIKASTTIEYEPDERQN